MIEFYHALDFNEKYLFTLGIRENADIKSFYDWKTQYNYKTVFFDSFSDDLSYENEEELFEGIFVLNQK